MLRYSYLFHYLDLFYHIISVLETLVESNIFVEVLPGVEALLPQSALAELQNIKNLILKVGDKFDTKIIKFNPQDKRISLGLPTDDV